MRLSCFLPAQIAFVLVFQPGVVSSFICSQRQQQGSLLAKHTLRNRLLQLQATKDQGTDDKIEKFAVSSSRGSKAIKTSKIRSEKPSGWDVLKSTLYGTVDGVGSLSEKLKGGGEDTGVQGGYSTIEKTIYSNASPGQRLMNEYRARSSPSSSSSSATPGQSSSSATTSDIPKTSAFDTFKGVVYDSVDVASQVFSGDLDDSDDSLQSFKPLVQPSLSSTEVQKALPDLQSNNIIKRKIAEGKIQNWEEKETKRQRDLEREEKARKFKESVYQIGDAVLASAEALSGVPSVVSSAVDETGKIAKKVKTEVNKVPGKVDAVVNTFSAIPVKVKATSDQVLDSVKESVQSTKKAVDEVKTIPTKIEASAKSTKQKVDAAVTAVDEVATNVKVFVGLEKPKPKPPKTPPPPPPTASEIGMKVAGSVVTGVATGTAKLAWWAGKGAAVAAWNGVQSATGKTKAEEVPTSPAVSLTELPETTKAPEKRPSSITSSDDDVDKEVQEALRLAQSAIDFADRDSEEGRKGKK